MYPTKAQTNLLWQAIGTSRYVYNYALEQWKALWFAHKEDNTKPKPNAYLLSRKWTKEKPEWAR